MRFELLGPDDLDHKQWDDLVRDSPGGTVYHTAEWAGLWPSAFRHFKALFAVGSENGRYQTGMPLIVRGGFPLARMFSMPMGGYGGMLVRQGLVGRAEDYFRGLSGLVGHLRPCYSEIVDFSERQGFLATRGYHRRQAWTHLADLSAHRSVPKGRRKRGAVQSEKRGVTLRRLSDEAELEQCYCLLQGRDRGYGQRTRYPLEFFRRIWKELAPKSLARINLAVGDGKVIGFSADLAFGETVTYWDGASDPNFRSLRPSDALIAGTIEWGLARGCRFLNLGGSPSESGGLARFKERWGGVRHGYSVYTRSAQWFRLLSGLRR